MNARTMPSIGIIGSGRVANAIGFLFHSKGIMINSVCSRNQDSGQNLANRLECDFVNSIEQTKADIIIVCVTDDEIFNVIQNISIGQKVLYTAGSISLESLKRNKSGVFYPLQSFSKNSEVDFSVIPICIEADNDFDLDLLKQLGDSISKNVLAVSSEKREKIHLSAVMTTYGDSDI